MTDETKAVEQVEEPEVQVDESEVAARKMGWKPKEEYDGDTDKWIPAKEYIGRAPLYDEIKKLRRKVGDVEQTIVQFKDHHSKVEQAAYQRALNDLKQEKVRALADGDHEKVVEIDEEMVELKTNKPTPGQAQKGPSPEFVEWVDKNPWYTKNEELREEADVLGLGYAAKYKGRSAADAYAYVSRKIKELYPHEFKQTPKVSAVESPRTSPTKARKVGWDDLPEHARRIGDSFVRKGVMTREQYVDDLVKSGQIK